MSHTRQALTRSCESTAICGAGRSDGLGINALDNRKAGKSTPITLCPDYGRAGCHGVDYLQVCSSRAKLWKKRRLIQSFEDRRNESLQPIPGGLANSHAAFLAPHAPVAGSSDAGRHGATRVKP